MTSQIEIRRSHTAIAWTGWVAGIVLAWAGWGLVAAVACWLLYWPAIMLGTFVCFEFEELLHRRSQSRVAA
jgi:hypothetical protein